MYAAFAVPPPGWKEKTSAAASEASVSAPTLKRSWWKTLRRAAVNHRCRVGHRRQLADGLRHVLGKAEQALAALLRLGEQRLLRRVDDAIAPLQLRPVDGEVGLMDELVRVVAVPRVGRDAH